MTPHLHSTLVEGCYRCDLNRDEILWDETLRCEDNRGDPAWACLKYDGTGLWCDGCLAFDRLFAFLASPSGSDVQEQAGDV